MFIPLVFLSVVAVLAICVDVSTICVVNALLDRNKHVINVVNVILMIYSWINLIKKLPIYSTTSFVNRAETMFGQSI